MRLQQLREQLNAKAREIRNHAENTSVWTPEAQTTFDNLETEYSQIENQIKAIESAIERDQERNLLDNPPVIEGQINGAEEVTEGTVFNAWLRGGVSALTPEQIAFRNDLLRNPDIRNDLAKGTDSAGGHLAPEEFGNELLAAMKAYGGMRQVARILNTGTGNSFEYPTIDETSEEGELVGENTDVNEGDPSFGAVTINAYKYSSKSVAVPFELLQDSRVDLNALLQEIFRVRLGRITNRHYTTGTGSGQPQGLATDSAVGKTGASGQTTSVIYDDLVDLKHSVDPAYRANGANWMFHDTTCAILKKLKDSDGRPLWLPSIAGDEPATLLGDPFVINQNVAEMAASARSILYGDMSKYMIRDVMNFLFFRMTDSAFTTKGQVGFLAFMRTDGRRIAADNTAVKHYANAAS